MNAFTRILRSKKSSTSRRNKSALKIESLEAREVPAVVGSPGTSPPPASPSNVIQYDAITKTLTVFGTDSRDKVEVKTVYGPSPDINTPGQALGTEITLGQLNGEGQYTEFASWGGFMSPAISRIRFYGQDGDDLFTNLTSIKNQLYGGNGDDVLSAGGGNDYISGQAGNDQVDGGLGNDTLNGGDGVDEIDGGHGNDSINAGAGGDFVSGGGGNDRINAGSGNDEVDGESGNDSIWGGTGIDELYGSDGNDKLYGGTENDSLYGGNGNDYLAGDAGKDQLIGNGGNDSIVGGEGNDFLGGADGNDTLDGSAGDDILHAGAGNDDIYGRAGDDEIVAGEGNDYVLGGDNDDHVLGQIGNDTIQGANGNDTLCGGQDQDLIYGGEGNDEIQGDDGNDTLQGGHGNDVLHGNDGNDRLCGEWGVDRLYGDLGSDKLYGGQGIDTLVAIDGSSDILFGGDAATTFGARDNYWMDPTDWSTNSSSLHDLFVAKKAIHVVSSYEDYWVGNTHVTVGIQPQIGDLVDPVPQDGDVVTEGQFVNKPLFGTGGPAWSDVDQGSTGDCYFMARLAALAKQFPQHIKDMVVDLGDGTYAVQFHTEAGGKAFVRVDADLWKNEDGDPMYADLGNQDAMWVAVIEKAWAIYRNGNASYGEISGGGGDGIEHNVALGLKVVKLKESANSAIVYVQRIMAALDAGKAVVLGGPPGMNDNTEMILENKERGKHIYMVHSVVTNAHGIPVKLKIYNLYGGGLTEITDFDMLWYCSGGAAALTPK